MVKTERFTISEWRRMKNISQDKMARLLGIHPNTYRKMESQPMNIRYCRLIDICKILGISIFELKIIDNEHKDDPGEEE